MVKPTEHERQYTKLQNTAHEINARIDNPHVSGTLCINGYGVFGKRYEEKA